MLIYWKTEEGRPRLLPPCEGRGFQFRRKGGCGKADAACMKSQYILDDLLPGPALPRAGVVRRRESSAWVLIQLPIGFKGKSP